MCLESPTVGRDGDEFKEAAVDQAVIRTETLF